MHQFQELSQTKATNYSYCSYLVPKCSQHGIKGWGCEFLCKLQFYPTNEAWNLWSTQKILTRQIDLGESKCLSLAVHHRGPVCLMPVNQVHMPYPAGNFSVGELSKGPHFSNALQFNISETCAFIMDFTLPHWLKHYVLQTFPKLPYNGNAWTKITSKFSVIFEQLSTWW